jgi:hypothetical protein
VRSLVIQTCPSNYQRRLQVQDREGVLITLFPESGHFLPADDEFRAGGRRHPGAIEESKPMESPGRQEDAEKKRILKGSLTKPQEKPGKMGGRPVLVRACKPT